MVWSKFGFKDQSTLNYTNYVWSSFTVTHLHFKLHHLHHTNRTCSSKCIFVSLWLGLDDPEGMYTTTAKGQVVLKRIAASTQNTTGSSCVLCVVRRGIRKRDTPNEWFAIDYSTRVGFWGLGLSRFVSSRRSLSSQCCVWV